MKYEGALPVSPTLTLFSSVSPSCLRTMPRLVAKKTADRCDYMSHLFIGQFRIHRQR